MYEFYIFVEVGLAKLLFNKVLPKAGLNGFDWTFVQGSTFVLRLKFIGTNPPLRQAGQTLAKIDAMKKHLRGAKNIGAIIEKRLNEVSVFSLADLSALTPVKAYLAICDRHPDKTIPICYYLYSLQGALLDLHWNDLSEDIKKDLLNQVGR